MSGPLAQAPRYLLIGSAAVFVLLVCGILIWKLIPPLRPSRSPLQVSTLYTAAADNYDRFARGDHAAPPRVGTFPDNTPAIAFYFTLERHVTASIPFSITIRDHMGARIAATPVYALTPGDTAKNVPPLKPDSRTVYPAGVNHVDLLIDGQVASSTTFTVAPTVAMPMIFRFYTSTRRAYDDRAKTPSAPLPPVSTFPAHTGDIAYFFEHSGGGTGVIPIQVYVRDHRGVIVASAVGRPPLNLAAKEYIGHVPAPLAGSYPAGTYTLSLLIHGQVVRSTTFTVLPPPPTATPTSPPPTATPTPQPPTPTATLSPHPTATPTPQWPRAHPRPVGIAALSTVSLFAASGGSARGTYAGLSWELLLVLY